MSVEIRAEMVADVWQVVLRKGDAVRAGGTVVVPDSTMTEFRRAAKRRER
ncbi:hypothetical protein [Streptomyces sp. 8N706]